MATMKKYKSTAPCGFCRFFGRVSDSSVTDVCWDCEVRRIREHLEILTDKALWEHDHKYLPDNDGEVRICVHCKHATPHETLYHAKQHLDTVCCEFDFEGLNDGDEVPTRRAYSSCDRWERAVDRSGGDKG